MHPLRLAACSGRLLADECEDRRLWNHEKAFALERDLDGGLAKEQRVVAAPGLHGHEPQLAQRLLPWLLPGLGVEAGHRRARPGRHDGPTLDRLAVDGRRGQVEPDLRALLAVLDLHDDAVADDDELLVVAD